MALDYSAFGKKPSYSRSIPPRLTTEKLKEQLLKDKGAFGSVTKKESGIPSQTIHEVKGYGSFSLPTAEKIIKDEKLNSLTDYLKYGAKKVGNYILDTYVPVAKPTYERMKEGESFLSAYIHGRQDIPWIKEQKAVESEYQKAIERGASRDELLKIARKSPLFESAAYSVFASISPIQFKSLEQMTPKLARDILKVGKNATQKQVQSAFRKALHKPEIQNILRGMSETSGASQMNILTRARDVLFNTVKRETTKTFLLKGHQQELPGMPKTKVGIPVGTAKTPKLTGAKSLSLRLKNPATSGQIKSIHIIAKEKALLTEAGKTTPQYRNLAKSMTGKKSVSDMTQQEASDFLNALEKIQPRFIKGEKLPPIISKSTNLTKPNFFEKEFTKPTIFKYLTPSDRYARQLGVYDLLEPSIKARTRMELERADLFEKIDQWEKEVMKVKRPPITEKAGAWIKNQPTSRHREWFDLLDKNKTAKDAGLTGREVEIFDEMRNLTETMLQRTNEVRLQVGLEPIQSIKTYITHIKDIATKEALKEKYPFPEEVKYWLNRVPARHIYNPTALHRFLDEGKGLYKDPFKALKSMASMDLKQVYLEKPNLLFREQIKALGGKIPADTKKWAELYINEVIKGYPTSLDNMTNNTLDTLRLTQMIDATLRPFGRSLGVNPAKSLSSAISRVIHAATIPARPKLVIRNLTQRFLNLGLYGTKAFAKSFLPSKELNTLVKQSDFWKISGRQFMERLPSGVLGKLERIGYKPYGWSHVSNVTNSMKTAYYASMDLVKNPKYKKLGWTMDDVIKEMEFGANTTQYWYNLMGMPEIYRSGLGRTLGTLQSWFQNYAFKYWGEMLHRAKTGQTGWGKKIPLSWRLGAIRHIASSLILIHSVKEMFGLDYSQVALMGTIPTYFNPVGQVVVGGLNYIAGLINDDEYQKTKGANQIKYSWKVWIPGSSAWKDWSKAWNTGDWLDLFFYKQKKESSLEAPGGLSVPGQKIEAPGSGLKAP